MPRADTLVAAASALGLELRIAPPSAARPVLHSGGRVQDHRPPPPPSAGLDRVRDRRLAELLAAVAARWEALPPAEREYLLADLWQAGGSGLRAQGSGLADVVAWLGWRVIEGRGRPGGGGERGDASEPMP